MSGGSFNYLCYTHEADEIMGRVDELDEMREYLIKYGYEDIAKDTQRLIEYIKSSRIVIETLADMLSDVFHAVEWRVSGDYGEDRMIEELEKYRNKGVVSHDKNN